MMSSGFRSGSTSPNEAIIVASALVTASPAGLRSHTPISQTASTPAGVTASQSDAATSASVSRRPAAPDSEVSQTEVLTSYITGLAGHPFIAAAPAAVASADQTPNPCALPPIRHSSILGAVTDQAQGLTIGQVAERTGLSVHALRFYEREGLLA